MRFETDSQKFNVTNTRIGFFISGLVCVIFPFIGMFVQNTPLDMTGLSICLLCGGVMLAQVKSVDFVLDKQKGELVFTTTWLYLFKHRLELPLSEVIGAKAVHGKGMGVAGSVGMEIELLHQDDLLICDSGLMGQDKTMIRLAIMSLNEFLKRPQDDGEHQ